MSDKIYNVGDSVWVASFELREEQIPCPVCFGTLRVTLILGNGESLTLPCDYCGKSGYEGPRGYVTEYRREPRCKSATISAREIRENGVETEIHYSSPDSHSYRPADVFETQAEAIADAQRRADEMAKEEETRAYHIKKNVNQTYSWNAGYHLREAKRLKEQIAYHERKAVLCKAKSKEAEPTKDRETISGGEIEEET